MGALGQIAEWPVAHAAAVAMYPDGTSDSAGPARHRFALASLTKPLSAWAILVAVEEGIVALDTPVHLEAARGEHPATLRHLLSHTSGLPFDGRQPIAEPGARRIYSNTGIEVAAEVVAAAAQMSFAEYLAAAVFEPLAMNDTALDGSPAFGATSTAADMAAFVAEMRQPTLISAPTARQATSVNFPGLAGIVPGIGRFNPCDWGLGVEIKGCKSPHWMGRSNSAATFGHFGGAGTFVWVDMGVHAGLVALTDRAFGSWSDEALRLWPTLSDTVIAEARVRAGG